jgi:hypothetical protein
MKSYYEAIKNKFSPFYDENIIKLFALGETVLREQENFDYTSLGLTHEHIDVLCDIAHEITLVDVDPDTESKIFEITVYAPVHAYRALKSIGDPDFIEHFIDIICEVYDDWNSEDALRLLKPYKKEAYDALIKAFSDKTLNEWVRITLFEASKGIATETPALFDEFETQCVAILKDKEEQGEGVNAFACSALLDITGIKHIELIRHVFKTKEVDVFLRGDIENIEIEFGLREQRDTPQPELPLAKMFRESMEKIEHSNVNEPVSVVKQPGRNDPCPCGSGKKYKKCCLRKES